MNNVAPLGLLSADQSAYRGELSTTNCLTSLMGEIMKSVDTKRTFDVVYADFR